MMKRGQACKAFREDDFRQREQKGNGSDIGTNIVDNQKENH